ncbi:MAG: Fpg/Nei family DNA glycosylase [Verrucomicrobiota bacterium]
MPELAEVAFFAKQWGRAVGERVERVHLHAGARDLREVDPAALVVDLTGARLLAAEARAKQALFRFESGSLGVHLGMAGRLSVAPAEMVPDKHDHLVLFTERTALVFSDYRMFGKVLWHAGAELPEWWTALPPEVLSEAFTREAVGAFLQRRGRAPIKAVLLMQARFPGIGNWMADEILWRARIRPDCPAGRIAGRKLSELFDAIREVASDAMREIAEDGRSILSHELSKELPETWLFNHRWRDGGHCPRTGKALVREAIGGRTTCWSPAWQRWPRDG